MPLIADRAGLSVATAYRYFSSLDELLMAYQHEVVVELRNFSDDCTKTGLALFEDVATAWARLVKQYGAAMVQLRSRNGFLSRLRHGDYLLGTVREAWERPIRSVMRQLDVPDHEFDYALFLHNVIFDPREILDLIDCGFTEESATRRLAQAYYGALSGWAGNSGK